MSDNTSPAIEAKGVYKNYLHNEVLRGFDLTVKQDVSFGCAGINGAGKSTFLKCLLDFCHYNEGTIKLFGQPARKRKSRSRMCFLPERFVPPYYLNGRQFIKFVLNLNDQKYHEKKAITMLEALDLDLEALVKPVRTYSKGMTQKLGLASIFLLERELYILDEPMSGLDPKARALLKVIFRNLRKRGATLFFTSHSLSDINEVCEEMALLHEGKICFAGTPDQLLSEHKSANNLEEAFMELISNPLPEASSTS